LQINVTTRLLIGFLLLVAVGAEMSTWLGIRMTILDDANLAVQVASPDFLGLAWDTAVGQGRLQFLLAIPLWGLPLYFADSLIYDLLHFGSYLALHALIFAYLSVKVSFRLAAFFIAVYFAMVALVWDHNLLVAVPLYHFATLSAGVAALLVALAAYRAPPNVPARRLALWTVSYVLLFLSFWGPEYQPVIFTLLFVFDRLAERNLLALHSALQSPGAVIGRVWPAVALFVLFMAAYFGFRVAFPSTYSGNVLSIAPYGEELWRTLRDFSASSNILFWMDNPGRTASTVPFIEVGLTGKHVTEYFQPWDIVWWAGASANFVGLVKSASLALVISLFMASDRRDVDMKQFLFVGTIGLFIFFFPNLLLALTEKYREWHSLGTLHYSYSSISHFGLVLVLAVSLSFISSLLAGARFSRSVVAGLTGIAMGGLSLATYLHNHSVAATMQVNTDRWRAVELLADAATAGRITGGPIVMPSIFKQVWSTPTDSDYWQNYLSKVYGKSLKINARVSGGSEPYDKVSHFRTSTCDGIVLVISSFSGPDESVPFRRSWISKINSRIFFTQFLAKEKSISINQLFSDPDSVIGAFSSGLIAVEGEITNADCMPNWSGFRDKPPPIEKDLFVGVGGAADK